MFFFGSWGKDKKTKPVEERINPKEPFNTYGLNDILHYIKRETGVDLFSRNSVIETKLKLFCERKEIYSFRKLFETLAYNKALKQELIDLVTVNETYFYREESQLKLAVDFALEIRNNVKILCAPCASGEEVYSLCMMLQETRRETQNFTILGIDINSEAIEKAENGIFSERSLHKLDTRLKEKFFSPNDKSFKIRKELFTSVYFKQINIFDHEFLNLGTFDIIFSRNMLIYFDDEFRLKTMELFSRILKPEGKLFLGHADIVPENRFFKKNSDHRLSYYTKTR